MDKIQRGGAWIIFKSWDNEISSYFRYAPQLLFY